MTNLEIVLLCLVVAYQVTIFGLLALQRSINNTVKDTLELMMKEQK